MDGAFERHERFFESSQDHQEHSVDLVGDRVAGLELDGFFQERQPLLMIPFVKEDAGAQGGIRSRPSGIQPQSFQRPFLAFRKASAG